ncbi:hypothetical protein RND71_004182 [Anisodus tanguticus]|uniref:UBA domain-containing protein n=1 Tax=Anisodus tanguticus TaxID=243964 RepID=A0AAE1T049_9SOLA|nr:hypothetical protein RND71_004182 [Anisodus tanguticus]
MFSIFLHFLHFFAILHIELPGNFTILTVICVVVILHAVEMTRSGNYPAPVSSTPEPPEDAIAMLVSMGFDRNLARQALIHSRNDINTATNVLLESQSH